MEDILTTTRQYIGDLRNFAETINQQVKQGGLPASIPYKDTSYENYVTTNRENETDAIRTIVDTTVRARREHIQKPYRFSPMCNTV